jgi:hypothetical protein
MNLWRAYSEFQGQRMSLWLACFALVSLAYVQELSELPAVEPAFVLA